MASVKEQVRTMIEELGEEELRRVLEFVSSLEGGTPPGVSGSSLLRFFGTLGPADADEIMRVIEEGESVEIADRITVNPRQCGGKPCVRGMRMTVADVLEYLAAGMTSEEILRDFPDLESADIQACLAFAAHRERNHY